MAAAASIPGDIGSLVATTPQGRRFDYRNRFQPDPNRRKGTDFPEAYECARLSHNGEVVATGIDAVKSFARIRKEHLRDEVLAL